MRKALLLASAAVGAAMLPLCAAEAQTAMDWDGFYAGIHGGYLDGTVRIDEGYIVTGNAHGFVGGVLAGYNFPQSPISPNVLGIEADFGWANVHGGSGGGLIEVLQVDDCYDHLYDMNWDGHARIRAGVPIGNALLFLAGGLAFANLDVTYECRESAGGVFVGGTIGGGVDLRLSPKLTARGEVLYDFYGSKQYDEFSASFRAWTLRAALTWMLP